MRNILPLWMYRWFIGCEPYLLFRCGSAEYYKFIFTGILILIITLITGVSSFYVAWDTFVTASVDHDYIWYLEVLLAIGLAVCWTLVIFNLFRFLVAIVASSDAVGWSGIGRIFPFCVQVCVALVLSIAMGFPLSILLLNKQLDTENQMENYLRVDQISMTVKYMDTHPNISSAEAYYEKLQGLKLEEVVLRARANAYKTDNKKFIEVKAALIENQRMQEDQYKDITDIRSKIELDFLKARESELSMHIIKRARFLWVHNAPITVFILLFIFLIYSSLILAKALSAHGLYEYLVKYEARYYMLKNGIEEIHSQVPINEEMLITYRFHFPEILLAKKLEAISNKVELAGRKLREKLMSSERTESLKVNGDTLS
jgi:hypothetical protein